jgi:S-adenosylmethionine:tRNA ribosyltransferase-isomerase
MQRRASAKLLVVGADGCLTHARRADLIDYLQHGDVVVANDAATLPASLCGVHHATGRPIEVRLAGRRSLSPEGIVNVAAVVFGAGDYHTPTEHRPLPPALAPGDRLMLGPLVATVTGVLGHPRLVSLHFESSPDVVWAGIARHGRPIQYAHVSTPLEMWDVWTAIAGYPAAFEPPSAGFVLDWQTLVRLRERNIAFVTLTHAAGISSTGDEELDARLPFDEPYVIPTATASAINCAIAGGRRIVAVGTTVVRALEHAATALGRIRAGAGVATQRITANSQLRAVDAIVTGVHDPATSHYQLLRAFVDEATLRRAAAAMTAAGYRTHEFGDSVLIERTVSTLKTSAGFLPDRCFSSGPASAAHAL